MAELVTVPEPSTPMRWVLGDDTGLSSLTICEVLADGYAAQVAAGRLAGWERCPPSDPSDFGRCFRLLNLFPGWRERLPEVAALHPRWEPFVDAWDDMERLYRQEFPAGRAPRLFALMGRLDEEGWRRVA